MTVMGVEGRHLTGALRVRRFNQSTGLIDPADRASPWMAATDPPVKPAG
jgi:hypothetical protein